jgi:hypothetical protein
MVSGKPLVVYTNSSAQSVFVNPKLDIKRTIPTEPNRIEIMIPSAK